MSGLGVMLQRLAARRSGCCPAGRRWPTTTNALPDSVLPPERGMMFITGPPDSTSPMLPDTVNVTSCALRVSVR